MSGEPGTEKEITELEDLQTELDARQDDLADMTQYRDNLADALLDALNQLDDIDSVIAIRELQKTYDENA